MKKPILVLVGGCAFRRRLLRDRGRNRGIVADANGGTTAAANNLSTLASRKKERASVLLPPARSRLMKGGQTPASAPLVTVWRPNVYTKMALRFRQIELCWRHGEIVIERERSGLEFRRTKRSVFASDEKTERASVADLASPAGEREEQNQPTALL